MRILGIDPGVAIVGFGLIESERGSVQDAAIWRCDHPGRACRWPPGWCRSKTT